MVEQAPGQGVVPALPESGSGAAGREFARQYKVEHTIHNENGEISEKNSYGNDSFPPRG